MEKLKLGLKIVINFYRIFILWIIIKLIRIGDKELIHRDICHYYLNKKDINEIDFISLILKDYAFRAVVLYRLMRYPIKKLIYSIFWRPPKTIELWSFSGKIGGGLFLSHNYMIIFVQDAGENFRVGPGVVIGQKNGKNPIIGNNVYVAANSTIIGGITIGDNVIIGAGSVITKNVPSNCIVVGNPARIIKQDGQRVNILL